MYLPRSLISKLYLHLQQTRHPLSPPVVILVALDPDALCACRILTRLLRHDYIPHKIQPVAGYADLERLGRDLVAPMMEVRGGSGGVVVCLGVGGMTDLGTVLGLEPDGEDDSAPSYSGVEVWVVDSHRPWNLSNIFGGFPLEPAADSQDNTMTSYLARSPVGVEGGRVEQAYRPGKGGIVILDDGDIEDDLGKEKEAYLALVDMPDVEDNGEDLGDSEDDEDSEAGQDREPETAAKAGQKRKSWSDFDEDDSGEDDRPAQRRRSNSSSPIPASPRRPTRPGLLSLRENSDSVLSSDPVEPPSAAQGAQGPSARTLRGRLLRMRRENEAILRNYYRSGTSYSEPISSMMYNLASELGREDNDLLWLAIVGVGSMELYGRSSAGVAVAMRSGAVAGIASSGWLGMRGLQIRQLLRDEVRRLNPPETGSTGPTGRLAAPEASGIIPTTARSPEDTSIRLSPEPKFLLIRHWSLYDSMLHSPYLFSRLRTWSETGLKRLHKLLAKMGVSLVQCKQSYTHMDMMLKRELRQKLLKYASMYNLEELVPTIETDGKDCGGAKDGWGFVRSWGWRATLSAQDVGVVIGALLEVGKNTTSPARSAGEISATQDLLNGVSGSSPSEEWIPRFWDAYDALEDIEALKAGVPTAQFLHRAIFTTGTAILKKKHISHLRAFRMCVVKDANAPDNAALFNHPGALTKLALWIGEALAEQERDAGGGRLANGGRGTPLVVASLDESRGVYVVVGMGGGGGADTLARDREEARRRAEARDERHKKREERKWLRKEAREARKKQERAEKKGKGKGDGGQEEEEEEEAEEEEDGEDDDSEGSEDSDTDLSDAEEDYTRERGYGLNKFGTAFQDVVAETNARVRIDSFEHCVVEVKKEDLGGFLESLSMKAVVG